MNQTNKYIFNLYHYLVNLRDTLEYTIDRPHEKTVFDQRKQILLSGLDEKSPLGNFFKSNPETSDKTKKDLTNFIEDVYGEKSTILVVDGDKIRVDHTQHIKIFDTVCGLAETLRDIIYGYLNYAKQQNQSEQKMVDLVGLDDRFYRLLVNMLVLFDFEKSFAEFQKVMAESQGKPTPQSNFIVKNELVKMAGIMRFVTSRHHFIDNETLDILREVDEFVEMTEGKRERRDNKNFGDLYKAVSEKLKAAVTKNEGIWKAAYNDMIKEIMESEKKPDAPAQA